ncbi:MAG TPA: transglutaminaseTgpA domain-containing protein [Egibacteraceae bacterium]|nr:transglutaminaseTgpA domain-containing protein [Egibacteraceae bacterium]
MSSGVQAPPVPRTGGPVPEPPPERRVPHRVPAPPEVSDDLLLLPVLALLAAACLPLGRAVVGWGVLQPVGAAVLVTVGLSWGARRVGLGPVGALVASVLAWGAFVTAAFLSQTTVLLLMPTPDTLEAFPQLWAQGIEHIRAYPAPSPPDPGLYLLIVTGVWAVSHAVDGLVFRLQAPIKAILLALALWVVPLLVTAGQGSPGVWTVPFLAASALLLLFSAGTDVGRWGRWVTSPGGRSGHPVAGLIGPGAFIAGAAILAGLLLAATLPGYDEPPWYELRGAGGTTVTTNPIVTIRPSLVAADHGPVMRVRTPRPVYLRTTALDVYSEQGEWTNAGIRGASIPRQDGRIAADAPIARVEQVDIEVEVVNLPGAVLVPAPYQPRTIAADFSAGFQYDPRLATLTTDRDATLQPGDRYQVTVAVPDPDPEAVRSLVSETRPEHSRLPGNVPPQVAELARQVVRDAGATTPFEQALAIQEEFQSGRWAYSLEPEAGHSGDAMLAFITHRVGYCEQYAGTMAVMLRTLGLPARVAVGFTPGELVSDEDDGPDAFVVTNGNAHAWVEVLFPGHGWLAFEPTPRTDGNVLTPSAGDPAPSVTDAMQEGSEPIDAPETPSPAEAIPEGDDENAADQNKQGVDESGGAPEQTEGDETGRLLIVLLAALIGVGAAVAVALGRRRARPSRQPLARVLGAYRSVEQIGRGLGMRPASWETDHEYLRRLSGTAATVPEAPTAAGTLGRRVSQARYAPALPVPAAVEAESAAGVLRRALLSGRSAPVRALVTCRGRLATAAGGVRARAAAATRRGRR